MKKPMFSFKMLIKRKHIFSNMELIVSLYIKESTKNLSLVSNCTKVQR